MLLSICIPTHQGRRDVLQSALESILPQITGDLKDQVEVCISDNASADGTKEMVERYSQSYPDLIVYYRRETNKWLLGNLIQLLEMAKGKFCWLFGSDDQIVDGGIARALQLCEQNPDATGISINWIAFDEAMQKEYPVSEYIMPGDHERPHEYTSFDDLYLNCALVHTYLSGNIVSKKRWMDVVGESGVEDIEKYFLYPHVYILALMSKKYPLWVWCPDKLVKYRTDYVSTISYYGVFHTFNMEIMAEISRLWIEILGGKNSVYKSLMTKQALKDWHPAAIRFFKMEPSCTPRIELLMLSEFTRHLYFVPGFWREVFPTLLVPRALMPERNLAFRLVRRVKNSFLYRYRLVLGTGANYTGGEKRK